MDRNKALKALIELKSRWMMFEEGEHRRKMQELAEQIKELRTKLKEFEDKPSVQ